MYCSTCGMSVAQGLSYCNYCGANLSGAKGDAVTKQTELFPDSLLWAIVSIFIVGLGSILALTTVMKRVLDSSSEMINAVILMGFLLMVIIEGVLLWLLIRQKLGAQERGATARTKDKATRELDAAQARALPEPVPSVTEHTTRTLDPIYSKRKAE